jgi:hypothetical protein
MWHEKRNILRKNLFNIKALNENGKKGKSVRQKVASFRYRIYMTKSDAFLKRVLFLKNLL